MAVLLAGIDMDKLWEVYFTHIHSPAHAWHAQSILIEGVRIASLFCSESYFSKISWYAFAFPLSCVVINSSRGMQLYFS